MNEGRQILIDMICARTGVSEEKAEDALLMAEGDVVEAVYILENIDRRIPERVENSVINLSKSLWKQMKKVQLSLHDDEKKLVSIPAVYGVVAASLFPVATVASLYSLTLADLQIKLSRE